MHAVSLLDDAMGYMYPAALGTAAKLGIADELAGGPKTVAELAAATGTHGPFLYRMLRLLASRGVFREDGDGRFHLTERADGLRADSPVSVRKAVIGMTSTVVWRPVELLETAVREGTSVFERTFGAPFFEYIQREPVAAALFYEGMAAFSDAVDSLVIEAYEFPSTGTLVDVGGGFGGLLLRALRRNPGLRGVLFDREQALSGHLLGQLGADDRWAAVGGDFFVEVPAGDHYLMKYVLHDWSDDECVRILTNCRRAMAPGGRVLIVESVLAPGNEPDTGKLLDLMMMTNLTGRERTEAEFAAVLGEAGLRIARVVPTQAPVSVVEAVPSA
ncbi:methyltransferase [Actinomycetes bacterium KLBMP 9797]